MRAIDFDNIAGKDLIDYDGISSAYKKYLIDVMGYEEDEANFVINMDFSNPYDTPYIIQDYEGVYKVDGKEYEVRSCYTDFTCVGIFDYAEIEPFVFYMLIDKETLTDSMISTYRNARKMYLI